MSASSWRPATPGEIREFYNSEFATDRNSIPEWVAPPGPKEFAAALTHRFPIASVDHDGGTRAFIRRGTSQSSPEWASWEDLATFFAHPAHSDPLRGAARGADSLADPSVVDTPEPPAEAAYYSLAHHTRFWVLAFDIDAKDIALNRLSDEHDTRAPSDIRADSGIASDPPVQSAPDRDPYHYAYTDIQAAIDNGFELKQYLEEYLEFTDVRVFYSGQGVHVYALDDDPDHRYTEQTRTALTEYLGDQIGLPIDKQVTQQPNRLLRIPRSLHAGVSRLVTELDSPEFNPRTDDRALPAFLTTDTTAPTSEP